jgi:diazepam-binding inhibitor (GABA receptor modulator, acyl-CoA-binding protein)
MELTQRFEEAQQRVKTLAATPDNDTLLALYGLFKQATAGDVSGKRPGMMDFKGRAKFDAWAGRKGTSKDQAMEAYVALVDKLVAG